MAEFIEHPPITVNGTKGLVSDLSDYGGELLVAPRALLTVLPVLRRNVDLCRNRRVDAILELQANSRPPERKQAEAELLRTLASEKELGQLRSKFVAIVSHEFRTMLGIHPVIRGNTGRLPGAVGAVRTRRSSVVHPPQYASHGCDNGGSALHRFSLALF
jgi:hypothetical protein